MSRLPTNARAALQSLSELRGRAALSSLGIMVAATAILLLISIAKGVQADMTREIEGLGVNLLIVLPARIEDGGFNPNIGGQSFLKESHADLLRAEKGVVRVATLTFAGGGVRAGKNDAYPVTFAASPEWFQIHPVKLAEGRVLTMADDDQDVALLGSVAKQKLFGEASALGKKVEINGRNYTVVGVTTEKNASSGAGGLFAMFGFENVAYIPFRRVKSLRRTCRSTGSWSNPTPTPSQSSSKGGSRRCLGLSWTTSSTPC